MIRFGKDRIASRIHITVGYRVHSLLQIQTFIGSEQLQGRVGRDTHAIRLRNGIINRQHLYQIFTCFAIGGDGTLQFANTWCGAIRQVREGNNGLADIVYRRNIHCFAGKRVTLVGFA